MVNTPTYLVDSSIFIFRAWFALPDTLTGPQGQPVNAVVGFMNFVRALMQEERPERIHEQGERFHQLVHLGK